VSLAERDVEFEGLKVRVWEGGAGFPVIRFQVKLAL
jgi:hypothetical protein